MIRLWYTRGTSVPVHEQLTAQLLLGILSRRLSPGERLPSVRDLARRLRLHPNTISAIYVDLARRGWVERRPGSGVFIRAVFTPAPESDLDEFVHSFLQEGVRRGFRLSDIERAVQLAGGAMQATRKLFVVDPDPELAQILAAEIQEATGANVHALTVAEGPAKFAGMRNAGLLVLATRRSVRRVRRALPGARVHPIGINSLEELLEGVPAPDSPGLVAVISKSETVLQWAATLLPSVGVRPAAFILRNPNLPDWTAGLSFCRPVAADLRSEKELPPKLPRIVFRLISRESLEELRAAAIATISDAPR